MLSRLKAAPHLTAIGAGAVLLGLALAVGGSEIAVAAGGAFIIYRVLGGESANQAEREIT